MKLLTYCDSNYRPIGDISIPIMKTYCDRHSIRFICNDKTDPEQTDVYWNKITMVRKAMLDSDWVVWCDVDILITNLSFDWIEYVKNENDTNLFLSSDFKGACLGFFLIRSCQWSKSLMEGMEFLGNLKDSKIGIYDNKNQREQDCLKVLLDFYNNVSSKVKLLPETIISNPRSKHYTENTFAHHFWGNMGIEKIAAEMRSHLTENSK